MTDELQTAKNNNTKPPASPEKRPRPNIPDGREIVTFLHVQFTTIINTRLIRVNLANTARYFYKTSNKLLIAQIL